MAGRRAKWEGSKSPREKATDPPNRPWRLGLAVYRGRGRERQARSETLDEREPADILGAVPRLKQLREALARRARDCGRVPDEIGLIAVSKTFTADEVWPTIAIGCQTVFGENRVQEAAAKWRDLRGRASGLDKRIELHLIGPLQSNKAREAVETFDVIQTIDREKIAAALAAEIGRTGKTPRLFVEVNTGAEPQKAGILPEETDGFLKLCRDTYSLAIDGLMCVPPANEMVSPHFALLSVIAE